MEHIRVKVSLSNGASRELVLGVSKDLLWQISILSPDDNKPDFQGTNLYSAMQTLRESLEAEGSQLLCAGARPDVAPSGMAISMSGGRKAYILHMGHPPSKDDLIDIFDYADAILVGTVRQQKEFFEAWLRSRKLPPQVIVKPHPGEIEEAKLHPNGWVYRISAALDPKGKIPPEAILGAWKVNDSGQIIESFIRNDKYDPIKWPSDRKPTN